MIYRELNADLAPIPTDNLWTRYRDDCLVAYREVGPEDKDKESP